MEPTTLTTLVLVIFALFVIGWGIYNLVGDWQPEPRRLSPAERVEVEFQVAVREMRRGIRDYERGHRSL